MSNLDWNSIHAGKITQQEILRYCQGTGWQALRRMLKNTTLEEKFRKLKEWLSLHSNSRAAQVQVTNYINALKRGGMIKDE